MKEQKVVNTKKELFKINIYDTRANFSRTVQIDAFAGSL